MSERVIHVVRGAQPGLGRVERHGFQASLSPQTFYQYFSPCPESVCPLILSISSLLRPMETGKIRSKRLIKKVINSICITSQIKIPIWTGACYSTKQVELIPLTFANQICKANVHWYVTFNVTDQFRNEGGRSLN